MIEEEKTQRLAGIELTTCLLQGIWYYRCATTAARGSPNLRRPFQLLDRPQRPQNLWRFIPGINFDFGRY